jgi:hypothetical protein
MFTISEIYCETVIQDNTSELSGIKLHLSKFLIKACTLQLQRFAAMVTAIDKMATPLQKAKCALWFNKTETSATTPSDGIWNLSTF